MKVHFLKSLPGLPLYEVVNDSGHRVAEVQGLSLARQFAASDKMLEVCQLLTDLDRFGGNQDNFDRLLSEARKAAREVVALVESKE